MLFKVRALGAILLLAACDPPHDAGLGPYPVKEQPANGSRCYLRRTLNPPMIADADTFPGTPDSLYIRLDVVGELANGVYDWIPGEKDSKTGTFTGTLENGLVTALYTYEAEGMTAKEEVLFKIEPDGLRIGSGELMESEGIWLFKDKSKAEFGPLVQAVACK